MVASKVRLYVDQPLAAGQSVPLSREQAHYLFGVMRLGRGDTLAIFNGRDGEFRATVADVQKRGGALSADERTRPLQVPPDLWLLFAPIKKARTDFIVEKAAEMGAARIVPVQTEFTNSDRIRRERLQAHAIEAAEQCGGTYVPPVAEMRRLDAVLDDWPTERRLMFCDETHAGRSSALSGNDAARGEDARKGGSSGPWAILIGPEGGFSDRERDRLRAMPQASPASLGPRILRADTAVVAAMTLWQTEMGDW